jgi:hypothetical protein
MKMTKFKELCQAYSKAQSDFENFRNESHEFAVAMIEKLKSYFEIPESQFSLYSVGQNNEFTLVLPEVINAISLRPDSLWQLGIGLTVCKAPETLPQELILLHILIRRDIDGVFYLKYVDENQEHKIEKSDDWNFIPFFDFLHDKIIETYQDQLTQFIDGDSTRRKIGY